MGFFKKKKIHMSRTRCSGRGRKRAGSVRLNGTRAPCLSSGASSGARPARGSAGMSTEGSGGGPAKKEKGRLGRETSAGARLGAVRKSARVGLTAGSEGRSEGERVSCKTKQKMEF